MRYSSLRKNTGVSEAGVAVGLYTLSVTSVQRACSCLPSQVPFIGTHTYVSHLCAAYEKIEASLAYAFQ